MQKFSKFAHKRSGRGSEGTELPHIHTKLCVVLLLKTIQFSIISNPFIYTVLSAFLLPVLNWTTSIFVTWQTVVRGQYYITRPLFIYTEWEFMQMSPLFCEWEPISQSGLTDVFDDWSAQ